MGAHTTPVRRHNHVSIETGDDAGASIGVLVEDPVDESAEPVHLDVSFKEHVALSPSPYERLLGDALVGDATLFPPQTVVEELWRIVQPLLERSAATRVVRPRVLGSRGRSADRAVRWWRSPAAQASARSATH